MAGLAGEESQQEDQPQSPLAGKIEALRQAGKSNEDIVKILFEEDLNTNVEELAQILQMDKMDIGRIKGRVSRWRKKKDTESGAPPEGPGQGLYKDEPNTSSILNEILTKHPDIPAKVKDEVMDWAKMKGMLAPQEVAYLLSNMKGISTSTASIIAQKYSLALQKAQQEGKTNLQFPLIIAGPGQAQAQGAGMLPLGFSQPQSYNCPRCGATNTVGTKFCSNCGTPMVLPQGLGQPNLGQGQQWPQWPYQPQGDVRSMVKEEFRELSDKLTEKLKPKESGPEQIVEIEEPIRDGDGSIIIDEDHRPLMRKLHVPVSQVSRFASSEDPELRVLNRMKVERDLFRPEGPAPVTEEKVAETVRRVLREETPRRGETEAPPMKPEDVKKAAAEAAAEAVEKYVDKAEDAKREADKERRSDERFNRLETEIRASNSQRTVDGYKDDGYRVFGQGLTEVSATARELVKDRKPLEVLIKDGAPILFGVRPSKELETASASDESRFFDRLAKQGFVTDH